MKWLRFQPNPFFIWILGLMKERFGLKAKEQEDYTFT